MWMKRLTKGFKTEITANCRLGGKYVEQAKVSNPKQEENQEG
jgi:hypothetical protein